jgi:hypothetical protein
MDEFERMCDFFGWKHSKCERENARGELKDAMTLQFNSIYGTDEDDLGSWQNLCRVLGIHPVPEGLHECRDVRRPANTFLCVR